MLHSNEFYYLIEFQYLGYRYHGWIRQPNVKTVQEMVEKTLSFVLGTELFKTISCSKTDKMVSARKSLLRLTVKEEIDFSKFITSMNENLPADIKFLTIRSIKGEIDIVNNPKIKTYRYYFSNSDEHDPFLAPYNVNFKGKLDMELVQSALDLYLGEHDFTQFAHKSSMDKCTIREILSVKFEVLDDVSYYIEFKSDSFLRHQVRHMIGALIDIGRGRLSVESFTLALENKYMLRRNLVPASGLVLEDVTLI